MRVLSFNFGQISGEKKSEIINKIQISSNIDIKSVTAEKVELIKEDSVIKVDYSFKIDYNENIANIMFSGNVFLTVDKEKSKEILSQWKNKKMPEDFRIFLFNFILAKCSIKAMQIEEDLNLPIHMPLPRVSLDKKESK